MSSASDGRMGVAGTIATNVAGVVAMSVAGVVA